LRSCRPVEKVEVDQGNIRDWRQRESGFRIRRDADRVVSHLLDDILDFRGNEDFVLNNQDIAHGLLTRITIARLGQLATPETWFGCVHHFPEASLLSFRSGDLCRLRISSVLPLLQAIGSKGEKSNPSI
jgi:hypothetical protein